MTNLEQLSVNVQRQIDAQNARIDSVLAKVEMLVVESQQQREDIRATNARGEAKFDELTKQINDTWKQTMIGVGGMIVALGGLLIAALK